MCMHKQFIIAIARAILLLESVRIKKSNCLHAKSFARKHNQLLCNDQAIA